MLPSIVQINAGEGLGSGVVFDNQGDIVTNAHVVGKSTTFKVAPATGTAELTAKLISSFPPDDLAVIRLDGGANGLKPVTFGDSSKLRAGQIVLAMGNPLGLTGTVTQGIVSAIGRTVSEPAGQGSPGATLVDTVQTSAAINPGNSGGALVDLAGQIVGIPTLAAVDKGLGGAAAGIGFAISSNNASDIALQMVKNGKVVNSRRAALGIEGRTVLGQNYQPSGVEIVSVTQGGGAEKAGLTAGEVITGVNGTPTPSIAALNQVLAGLQPGSEATVAVTRNGGNTSVKVTLGELPAS